MIKNDTINGYYLGEDGAWIQNYSKNNIEDVKMETEQKVYDLGTKKIEVHITNNTDGEKSYGEQYNIEKFENNTWHKLEQINTYQKMETLNIIKPHSTVNQTYSLSDLENFKDLTPGKYRIVQSINLSATIAEFELK